ncbi:MAG: adenylyltransferase/cytidyltransferase family protein [Patescibacteria group bacterium]
MTFGTFDIFHQGHKYFLQQAKKYGDYLIVIIARDATVKQVKLNLPDKNEKQRQQIVIKSQLANKVVLGNLKDKYAVIKKFKPDIICLGYDQKYFVNQLQDKIKKLKLNTKIIRLRSYKPYKYKTSIIKNK